MADERFLSRWARLKQEAVQPELEPPPALAADTPPAAVDAAPADEVEPFDPATLPPIESIEAGSDIKAFLARNVPADLVKAALRRAWAADPAIRDFVGLAENSWDFTAPDGVPGFGPMRAGDDIGQMLAFINRPSSGSVGEAIESAGAAPPAEPQSESMPGGITSQAMPAECGVAEDPNDSQTTHAAAEQRHSNQSREEDVAPQDQNRGGDFAPMPRRRPHGGALPE